MLCLQYSGMVSLPVLRMYGKLLHEKRVHQWSGQCVEYEQCVRENSLVKRLNNCQERTEDLEDN